MNITELRYLVAIMKTGSVSAAAKQLYVAQPNVSKALKNLEEEYGLLIFERSSTGMLPTEQGRSFITQAAHILDEIDKLEHSAQAQELCAELRVAIPHTTYASYAAADFVEQAAASAQLRVHVRECCAAEALSCVLRRGYHMALLRYAAEAEEDYAVYCRQHGLHSELIMEFDSYLLTNRSSPLAAQEITDMAQLNDYIEIVADDGQPPDGHSGGLFAQPNPSRRVHVYERCSQFTMLQRMPNAYMWAAPTPRYALDQYGLALRRCPARGQKMRDALIWPEKSLPRHEQELFAQLLRREAEQTVK